jgi:hypothetical protein
MSKTKLKAWILGILVTIVVAAASVDWRHKLTMHLVDKAGKPMSCRVRVVERSGHSERERVFDAPDGTFRVKQISHFSDHRICVMDVASKGLQSHIIYHASTNGSILITRYPYGDVIKLAAGQTDVSIPFELWGVIEQ